MWYKLHLSLKEVPSRWTGLHRASGQSVAWVRTEDTGSGLATGKSALMLGTRCVCGFRLWEGIEEGPPWQCLVTGLRVLPPSQALLLRSWPGSRFPQLSSRSFPLPARWCSWQCASFSDHGKGSIDTAGSGAHGWNLRAIRSMCTPKPSKPAGSSRWKEACASAWLQPCLCQRSVGNKGRGTSFHTLIYHVSFSVKFPFKSWPIFKSSCFLNFK